MTITNLLPQLHNLSRDEKLKIIKFLVQDLEAEEVNSESLITTESVFLSQQDWEQVISLISSPHPLNSALISAFKRYKQEVKN
jgi:uncharacterized protein (DUF1778 family)